MLDRVRVNSPRDRRACRYTGRIVHVSPSGQRLCRCPLIKLYEVLTSQGSEQMSQAFPHHAKCGVAVLAALAFGKHSNNAIEWCGDNAGLMRIYRDAGDKSAKCSQIRADDVES
jgi:hypothetical protein